MQSNVWCVTIALCATLYLANATARPQELNRLLEDALSNSDNHSGNNGSHDDDDFLNDRPAITLVINDDRFEMTDFPEYDAVPLDYLERIKRARIENAPSGYGCFFWSPIGLVMSSKRGITFVSQTFYSDAGDYMYFDFLANPEYLVCFKFPRSKAFDDSVAVWVESTSTDTNNFKTAMGFVTLSSHDERVRFGNFLLPDWPSLDRAAIVHAFNPETACIAGGGPRIIEGTGPLETISFSVKQPSIERLLSPVSVICYG